MPINQNGLGGTGETGGVILVSVSAKDQATLASSNVWSNMIAGSKNLTGITTSKYNNGSQTFLRVSFAAAAFSQAIVHMKITSQGLMHYYDKRWILTA
ncbi:TPA: hypothetical protein ACGSMW_000381 [Escherichia coli]|nr:hypothetical protein [Escherichia coli]HAI0322576.1 hypothetical protein [Escherichia coli]HDV2482870.1 hypothetical protein [Escherichia coli]HDV2487255.1 hypothetical protein [Escherichia coli]HEI2968847.1 hypothetical protein [Escherichia coli]